MTTTNNPTGMPVFPLKSAAPQQYNRVQNLLIGLMLLMTLQLQAQRCVHVFEPIFFDNKILHQLKNEKLVDDIVQLEDKLLYLKIKTPKGSLEYFQLDDSTFYSREKVADQYKK